MRIMYAALVFIAFTENPNPIFITRFERAAFMTARFFYVTFASLSPIAECLYEFVIWMPCKAIVIVNRVHRNAD